MIRFVIGLMLLCPTLTWAAIGEHYVQLDKANFDLTDKASLQSGARTFMNYCLGCHQMQYQRYQRSFHDLGIPDKLGHDNLQFTGDKVTDYITNAMPKAQAQKWFGAAPPDLTLVARVRGADWIYTYLRSFYADPKRPWGVNNLVFPDVGMPHVLEELQGLPRKTYQKQLVDGQMVERYVGLKTDGTGLLSTEEYDKTILDLVNFLVYTGEPTRLQSEHIGRYVLIFIVVLFVFVYLLKKEYWREVH